MGCGRKEGRIVRVLTESNGGSSFVCFGKHTNQKGRDGAQTSPRRETKTTRGKKKERMVFKPATKVPVGCCGKR